MAISPNVADNERAKFEEATDGKAAVRVNIIDGAGAGGSSAANAISTLNSSTTILDPGGTNVFTGTGEDVSTYAAIAITVSSDVDSGTDGLQFQFSTDNTNWDDSNDFNLDVSVSDTRRFQFPVTAKYFRIVYTNGSTIQTYFRLQTIFHTTNILPTIHRLDTGLSNDRSVTVNKSVIAGETTAGGGAFVNVKVDPSGSVQTVANQDTHDDLNANVNLQVNDVDVSGTNAVPITNDTAGTLATSGKQLADNHNVTISNTSMPVTGPLTNAELRLSDVGVAVSGLLGDGHNVTVDNIDSDGIPIINQTGDTLSVGGAVTVTSGAVTVSQGTRSSLNANATIQVQGIDVTLTSGLPIQNETGTNLGIDVVNVSGSAINDGNAIHVSQGTAANLKATVIAAGDIAHDSADSGNPIKTGAKAIDFNTSGHTADVAAADRVNSIALQNGQHLVADLAHRKAITLGGLDDIYDTANESHNSGDIDVTGFRYASFMFTIESNSNPTDFQWTLEEKSSGGTYFEVTSGFWAFFKYEDVGTGTAINVSVMFPLGGADTIRIVGTVSSDATASPGGKFYTITNSEIGLRN